MCINSCIKYNDKDIIRDFNTSQLVGRTDSIEYKIIQVTDDYLVIELEGQLFKIYFGRFEGEMDFVEFDFVGRTNWILLDN